MFFFKRLLLKKEQETDCNDAAGLLRSALTGDINIPSVQNSHLHVLILQFGSQLLLKTA